MHSGVTKGTALRRGKMPQHCAAYNCKNQRTVEFRQQGVTFHRFPKEEKHRKLWEVALKRKNFIATDESVLCCHHFKPEDFDRTGQTVRLKSEVTPSVISFPAHFQTDHTFALPSCPVALKKRLIQATEQVITLEWEKSIVREREMRAKNHLKDILQEDPPFVAPLTGCDTKYQLVTSNTLLWETSFAE